MSYLKIEVNEMLLHYDRRKCLIVPVIMLLCNLQFVSYSSEWGGEEEAQGNKGNILYISKGNKEWFCPWGHVGLERNDSQCRPPETNCHWPPWIFQGTLDWKWTIQFPTGSLAIFSLCIIEKASTFWFGQSDKNIHRMLHQ